MAIIDILFKEMKEKGASDMHLVPCEPPIMRINGHLSRIAHHKEFAPDILMKLLTEILDDGQKKLLMQNKDLDFAYTQKESGRFRCNYFFDSKGLVGAFRVIADKIMTLDELYLPDNLKKILDFNRGLFLVAGPSGSGKTTTMAALVDHINQNKGGHIITVEDPVEFIHNNKQCLITQRQVGTHVLSFPKALKSTLRQDPNVILVGELRDSETISLALTAAETGVLVLGTLKTNSASRTVNSIVSAFPQNQQNQIKTMLSGSLKAIAAQQLLKRKDNTGRIAAVEILFSTPAVGNLIRKDRAFEIDSIIETGKSRGMQTMDHAILSLLKQGLIDIEEARAKGKDKTKFAEMPEEDEEEVNND